MKAARVLTAEEKAALTPEDIEAMDHKHRISCLPRWAQDHIATIERERDAALRQHAEFLCEQPESPFYAKHLTPGRGMPFKRPLKATAVGCRHSNFYVELRPDFDRKQPSIAVSFELNLGCGRLAIVPEAGNRIRIVEVGGGSP